MTLATMTLTPPACLSQYASFVIARRLGPPAMGYGSGGLWLYVLFLWEA